MVVVVWLHILGPYWCLYVVLFGSRLRCDCNTEICRSCFNVNFNVKFNIAFLKRQLTGASVGE